jgi:hypothetical protein
LDLVGNNQSFQGGVWTAIGNGDGSFQPARISASGSFGPFAVGDVNGDSRPDIVAISSGGVTVLLGNGDGTFRVGSNFAAGQGPTFIATGDLNGDGLVDLAVVNQFSNDVSVFYGKGDGTFQTAAHFAVGSFPKAVIVADLNGDGLPDLAVTNGGSLSVSVLQNLGSTFAPSVGFGVGVFPTGIVAGDFNGDAKIDLAVIASGIWLLFNNTQLAPEPGSSSVASASTSICSLRDRLWGNPLETRSSAEYGGERRRYHVK